MSWQKQYALLKKHIDERFDEIEKLLKETPTRFIEHRKPAKPAPMPIDALGLTSQQESALTVAGYATVDDLAAASDDELLAIDGVGKRTVEFIRGRTG